MRIVNNIKSLKVFFTAMAAIVLCSCEIEPPLHLRTNVPVKVNVVYHEINLNVMWQLNWQAVWTFDWNEDLHGKIGYTTPSGVRMHLYSLDDKNNVQYHNKYNFTGFTGEVPIKVGIHNMLFHNNDTEYILYYADNELAPITVTTRAISKGLAPAKQVQAVTTKADSDPKTAATINEYVVNAPDQLFSLYYPNYKVSDNYKDYELIDGKYVAIVNGEIRPITFIYLVQVKLLNNNGQIVGCDEGAALTGMANSVNLTTGTTGDEHVTVKFDMYYQAGNGTNEDMLGGRVMTFGMCGYNPYDTTILPVTPATNNYLALNISYVNGTSQNIQIDVTDQVKKLPTGGVITLDIDVNDFPMTGGTGGGGFTAGVVDWDDNDYGYVID